MSANVRTVEIIGAPMDLGANMRGAIMGPAALRIAGLDDKIRSLGYEVLDTGDLPVPVRETISPEMAKQKYLKVIEGVNLLAMQQVEESLAAGRLPLTIGGDHSIAIGTISGTARHYRQEGKKLGLLWIDAHADLNTLETSPSQNIHGMPLATVLGHGHENLVNLGDFQPKVSPEHVALVGIRTLDDLEKEMCKSSNIAYYTMRDIDEQGMFQVMKKAIDRVTKDTDGIHVSFDIDGVDPAYAPGVSTPESGGLSYREAHLLLEMVADTGKLAALDVVELNPINDESHKTANFAVELIQSALGKSIV